MAPYFISLPIWMVWTDLISMLQAVRNEAQSNEHLVQDELFYPGNCGLERDDDGNVQ